MQFSHYAPDINSMLTVVTWLSFAFAFGLLMRFIGLPPLVGYLVAGFTLSIYGHNSHPLLESVAHAGVLVLLFSVGLKIHLRSLLRLEILAGALLHMLITVSLVLLVLLTNQVLALSTALFIGIALSFSSTVVAAKVLEGKRELRAFHGRVAIGILVVQDIVAIIFLSNYGSHSPSPWALILLSFFLLRPALHWLLNVVGHGELVILYGLVLALAAGGTSFEYFGMSSELGALLLGMLLADHKRAREMSNSLWGLKEILLVGFFLQIGLAGHPDIETFLQAFALNLLVPIKALLFFFILLLFRLRARSSFLASLSLATYSEFGLIVANLGVSKGILAQEWLTLLALTVALSFVLSAPLNRYAHGIYQWLEKYLLQLQSSKRHPDDEPINLGNSHTVIVGMGRVGTGAYDLLTSHNERVIGLDSDPDKVSMHRKQSRRVLYADSEDPGLWSNLNLESVHSIMFCIPEIDAKLMAIRQIRQAGFKGMISATALYDEQLQQMKQAGADYVYNYYDVIGSSFAEYSIQHAKKHTDDEDRVTWM